MKTPIRSLFVLALSAVLPACGGAAEEAGVTPTTPAAVTRAFFGAAQEGDTEGFLGFLTEGARDGIASGGGGLNFEGGVDTFTVGEAELEGDEARVPVYAEVDGQRQDLTLRLREVADGWRIWGFDVVIGTETAMTIDLESLGSMMSAMEDEMASAFQEAFEEAAMGGSEQDIRLARERFEAVSALTLDEHEAAWRIDFEARGEPASELLAALLADTGLTLDPAGHAGALAQPVTLRLEGVSRIEAFERVCASVGVAPLYPSPQSWDDQDRITLTEQRSTPVAFAGPFLVEVAALEENAPNTTGEITLAVHALGLAPEVLAYQSEMGEVLAIDSILSKDGENVNADDGTQFWGTPTITGALFSDQTALDLKLLLRGVRRLDVSGRVKLRFATVVQETSFDEQDEGPRRIGDLTFTPTQWGETPRFELTGRPDFEDYEVRLSPLDSSGAPLGVLYSDSSAWGDALQAGLQAAEPVATLEVKLCRTTEVEVPFTLEDVPLARWNAQPEALEPLSFPGDAPVVAEFQRFTERGDFPKLALTLHNGANKDALEAQATFVYLDAAGRELEDFPHTLTGEYGFEGQAPLAVAGEEATQEATAFFVPEGTAKVRIRIDAVTFADASEWKRPE